MLVAKTECLAKCLLVVLACVTIFAVSSGSVFATVSSADEACFVVLHGEVKRHYNVSFPLNYSQFNSKAALYRSMQNLAGRISDVPQFRHYAYDFGRQTGWAPNSPFFVDKLKPAKEFTITFYYANGTFEGCGFTKISPLGSYSLSTISASRLSDDWWSARYGDINSRDFVKDGFRFNLAKYTLEFTDRSDASMARYDRISLASDLTDAYKGQLLANKIVSYSLTSNLKEQVKELKSEVSDMSNSAQKSVLVWHAVYWVIIIALLVLIVFYSKKYKTM